jgi:tripartite-type tricarboxylate transporter receptor subunit TctC
MIARPISIDAAVLRRAAALPLAALLMGPIAGTAVAADGYFSNKTVTFYVGNPPGGGYDAYTRTLARYLPKYLPGEPTVVVKNVPGAAGLVLANQIYNTAPKDGTAFGMFASSVAFAGKFNTKGVKFDITKFTWIGNVDQTTGTCAVWNTSGIKSFEDLYTRETLFGASGANSVNSEHARGFNALLGTRIKVIHGYAGSTGVLYAVKRGELQGACGFALSSLKSVRRDDWKSGRLKVIIQLGYKKNPELAGIPHIYDMVRSDEEKKVLDLIYGRHVLGRPVAAPPGLSKDVTAMLRTAFNRTVVDKEFLALAARLHLPVDPWDGAEVEKIVAQFVGYPPSVYQRAIKAMAKGKIVKVALKQLSGTISKITKKGVQVTDGAGKVHNVRISGRRSKVTIAGAEAKSKALKVGMACSMDYFGDDDLAPKVACK